MNATDAMNAINAIDADEVIVKAPAPYNLRRTLTCGQAFRWRWEGEVAVGILRETVVRAWQRGQAVHLQVTPSSALPAVFDYLTLDEPLSEIEGILSEDPVLRKVLIHTSGIALLRQDPWECLLGYVISSWNSIPKIELSLDRLARQFGRPLGPSLWSLPSPPEMSKTSLRALRRCSAGYRAPYIRGIARAVHAKEVDLEALRRQPFQQARRELLRLPGVGEKVVDCVLLFAMGHRESFPVDVWVKRAVERLYFQGRHLKLREIQEFARERFGPLAGYAQQHLFAYARRFLRDSLQPPFLKTWIFIPCGPGEQCSRPLAPEFLLPGAGR